MEFNEIDLNKAGAQAAQTEDSVQVEAPVPVEPSAADKLEDAQRPKKRDLARAGLLSPEVLALLSEERAASAQATAIAVQQALAAVLPGIITQLKTPSPKEAAELAALEAKVERDRREQQQQRAQNKIEREGLRAKRAKCPHLDMAGKSAICLVHNQISNGGKVAGLCMQCNDFIASAHYELLPPSRHTVNGGHTEQEALVFIHELELQGTPGVKLGPVDADGFHRTIIMPAHKDYKRVELQDQMQANVVPGAN